MVFVFKAFHHLLKKMYDKPTHPKWVLFLDFRVIVVFNLLLLYTDAIEMSTNTAYGTAHQLTSTDKYLYEDLWIIVNIQNALLYFVYLLYRDTLQNSECRQCFKNTSAVIGLFRQEKKTIFPTSYVNKYFFKLCYA